MPPKSVNIQNKYVDMQGSYAIMRVTDLLENFVLTWVKFFLLSSKSDAKRTRCNIGKCVEYRLNYFIVRVSYGASNKVIR